VLKKKAKPKSQGTGGKSNRSDTTKKARERGEELVTYTMKKARMASSQYIKCADPNHIKKDYTNLESLLRWTRRRLRRGRRRQRRCLQSRQQWM